MFDLNRCWTAGEQVRMQRDQKQKEERRSQCECALDEDERRELTLRRVLLRCSPRRQLVDHEWGGSNLAIQMRS